MGFSQHFTERERERGCEKVVEAESGNSEGMGNLYGTRICGGEEGVWVDFTVLPLDVQMGKEYARES